MTSLQHLLFTATCSDSQISTAVLHSAQIKAAAFDSTLHKHVLEIGAWKREALSYTSGFTHKCSLYLVHASAND
jgi:hypothetical protein